MTIKVAKAVGLNTDQSAAQVVSSIGETSFFGVINLTCDDAFIRGRQLLSDLVDYYSQESTENLSETLNNTFQKAQDELKDLEDFDLLLAVISSRALYILAKGKVIVYLKRAGKLSSILNQGDGQLVSGFIQEEDRIFLTTSALAQFFENSLNELLDLPPEGLEDELAERIVDNTDEGLAGLVISIPSETTSESLAIPNVQSPAPLPSAKKINLKIPLKIENVSSLIVKVFPRSGRVRLILALILILIIGVGLGLKIKSAKDLESATTFNQLLQSAKDDYNAALGLQSLNPTEANNKIQSSKTNLDKALEIKPKDKEAIDLKNQLEANGNSLAQKFDTNFSLYLDLNLIKQGFRAKNLSLNSGQLLVLDPNNSNLVLIDLAKKSHKILGSKSDLGSVTLSSINGSKAFLLSDKGLLKVETGNKKLVTVSKTDSEWGKVADIYGFGSNLYVLDTLKSQIWKYVPTSDGYSQKQEYLKTKADLAGAIRMQIESSVYLLKQGGEILRFTKGEVDHFSIGGVDKNIKEPKSFFVSSETDNLYLLDSGNSRLLVLSKSGEYKSQYLGDKFASASDLVVDEEGKKVYLLENDKIYQMELK